MNENLTFLLKRFYPLLELCAWQERRLWARDSLESSHQAAFVRESVKRGETDGQRQRGRGEIRTALHVRTTCTAHPLT